jgi:transglutaminase-like putative cysteine protease
VVEVNQAADERAAVGAAVATLLAALTLSPLVQGHTWLIVAALVVVAVMVTGIVVRQLVSWWPIVVGGQVAVLAISLTLLFARGEATGGVIPGPEAVDRFRGLIDSAMAITREQRPPVESSQGIVLLVVASIGLVAIAVDLLAASVRQPALAGLPLLAVYCVPAALLPGGLPWYYFVAAAAGFLVLLSADAGDRVRSWGRVLSAPSEPGLLGRSSPDGGLARGGRRVGVVAVLVAAIIPAVVPGLGDRLLNNSGGEGNGAGNGSTIRTINPILQLRQNLTSSDDTPLIQYTTDLRDPAPLRIVTADVYDGKTWSPRSADIPPDNVVSRGLPPPPGLEDTVRAAGHETDITVGNLAQSYLPLPYPTQTVDVHGDWLYDSSTLNVVGHNVTTRGLSYHVRHLDVEPSPQQLDDAGEPPASLGTYRTFPRNLPTSIIRTAQDVTKDADTDYAQAVLLQRWFRRSGGFEYSTDAPPVKSGDGSTDAIAAFLEAKKGYCVHFASAMALMARTLGIPARVAVGFLPGKQQADGSWVITAQDAHAWPELYFPSVGWVRFEPTPRSGSIQALPPDYATPPAGLLPGDDEPSLPATLPSASSSPHVPQGERPDESQSSTPSPSISQRLADLPWRLIAVVLVLVAAAVSPLVASGLARRRRWRRAVTGAARTEAAWEDLRQRLGDAGVRWAASWTPRALQRRLITDLRLGGSEQAAMGRLVADLEAARYAPPEDAPGRSREELMRDVGLVVAAAEEVLPAKTRWSTRLFPPSGVRVIRDTARRADESASTAGRAMSERTAALRDSVGATRGRDKE